MLAAPRAPVALPADGWAYEPKWDGWRCVARVHDGAVTLLSRTMTNLTARFPELHEPPASFRGRDAFLDGELVALDQDGRPSFALLGRRHARSAGDAARAAAEIPVRLVAFDLLHLGDELLLEEPWERRRALLDELGLGEPPWTATAVGVGAAAGDELLRRTDEQRLEGVVAKRLDAPYRPGERTDAWVKLKHPHARDVLERVGGRRSWGSGRRTVEKQLPRVVLAE